MRKRTGKTSVSAAEMSAGLRIRLARIAARMTQTELSRRTRILQSRISLIENDLQEPTPEELAALWAELEKVA